MVATIRKSWWMSCERGGRLRCRLGKGRMAVVVIEKSPRTCPDPAARRAVGTVPGKRSRRKLSAEGEEGDL
jgi:hypothetical protein